MAELLRAPTEGYAEAIMIPSILAEQFELKHSLNNMMTSDQFLGLEKDNPHDHIPTVNYNQGNSVYRPPGSGSVPSNTVANLTGELNAITTRSGIVLDGPSVHILPPFINPKEDERVEETLTDQDLVNELKCKGLADLGASINLMPLFFWKKLGLPELISTRITLKLANRAICTPARIARDVFVPVGKFTFPADFIIVDYKSDPRVSLILGRPFLRMARALNDIHGEEIILRDDDERLTLNMRHDTSSYSNQPQKESINLINVFNNLNEYFLEDLFSTNQPCGNPTSHLILTSPEVKDDIVDPEGGNVLPEKLLDLDSTKDLHPPHHVNPLSGSTTYSSSPNQLLEEFADELALITFPPEYDDDFQFVIESYLKEIEYLLHHDPIKDIDSILKNSIYQSNLAGLNDNFVDSMPEMFIDEHALDYSSPLLFDEYDDDLFEVEFDTKNVYDDPFDSKGEKIKESKLLMDELDLPCNFLFPSKYDSCPFEDFSKVDALPSTNNKDKVFNLCILIQENLFEIITRVA
nr:reverse transcriptase domain-containing protein [Tanacetum cinerariifolium]